MKKRWPTIMAMLLALLVLVATAVPVLAENEDVEAAGPQPVLRAALAILAPRMSPVGEEVTMTVFQRSTQDPVKDAGVWALTREEAEDLKGEIARLREEGEKPDHESLVSARGIFLGTTHGNGQLKHAFTEGGWYLLVAVKGEYIPGRIGIAIRTIRDALAILAPGRAPVGEEVTMTVLQRATADAVKDAGVWALTREEAEDLKAETARLREEGEEPDWESLVSARGIFLGTTKGNGQLKHAFTEGGRYVLVAVKEGYIPGRTGIAIGIMSDALAILAPRIAPVGEEVTMTVFQRSTQDPVKDAGVWALTREEAEDLKGEIARLKGEGEEPDWESLVSARGIFLGTTKGNGQLKHAFTEGGRYLLVAVKEGYIPGRTGIAIKVPRTIEAPD